MLLIRVYKTPFPLTKCESHVLTELLEQFETAKLRNYFLAFDELVAYAQHKYGPCKSYYLAKKTHHLPVDWQDWLQIVRRLELFGLVEFER